MELTELKTSQEWMIETEVDVIDPDGWDRQNFFWSFFKEQITREEFERRLADSTCDLESILKKELA